MTPEQKIKNELLLQAIEAGDFEWDGSDITAANIDEVYKAFQETDAHWDYESEFREGQERTGLPCDYSRHYESSAVATKLRDGSWVGWTYWYGGGKHGEPEAIDWMGEAYDLTVTEEQKIVTVRTFVKN